MDWSTLVATALGALLAVAGGFFGQWWAEKRATDRELRERHHEQRVWVREQRVALYKDFLAELASVQEQARVARYRDAAAVSISLEGIQSSLDLVEILGSPAARHCARQSYRALITYDPLRYRDDPERREQAEKALDDAVGAMRQQVRLELGTED